MKTVLCCLLLASLFHPSQLVDEKAQSFRVIPIPTREHGYNNFASIAFTTKKDLDAFLKDTSTQNGWNRRQAFEDALLQVELQAIQGGFSARRLAPIVLAITEK